MGVGRREGGGSGMKGGSGNWVKYVNEKGTVLKINQLIN